MMTENINNKDFLGTGWSFPPSFSKTGEVLLVSAEEDIKQSLRIILATGTGERIMHPDFGADMTKLLFEPLTTSLVTYMKDLLETAFLTYETRVKLNDLTAKKDETDESLVILTIDYTIKTTNTRTNLVYPFYLDYRNNNQ